MEQHNLMKIGQTQILREQGGETAPEIPQNLKFRSFDRFRHVVVQKIQLDEWNNLA
jgi:hypothetical protein